MTAPIDTTFVSGTTITSEWLNGVNDSIVDYTKSRGFSPFDKAFNAVGTGLVSDTAAIQAYFNACASAKVIGFISHGTFLIDDTVVLPSNLHIVCGDSVVFQGVENSKPMFLNGTYGGTYLARSANSNITLDGGTYDFAGSVSAGYNSGLAFGKASDITVKNVHFQNIDYGHFIEFNSILRGRVENCTFISSFGVGGQAEAIQIDAALPVDLTTDGVWDLFPYFSLASADNYTCDDIKITSCIFTNCVTAVGSHSYMLYASGLLSDMNTDINISDIIVTNCSHDAIRAEGWFGFSIDNITIHVAGNNGIRINDCLNFAISNVNINSATGNGVLLYKNTYEMQSGTISNIVLRSGLDVVKLDGLSTDGPSNISITSVNGYSIRNGISMAGCDTVLISGAMFEACSDYGIKCDTTKNINSRVNISDIVIRNTTLDNALLYLSSSVISGCIFSLPASTRNNITTHGCSGVVITGCYCNGANLQDQIYISGTSTLASSRVVLSNVLLQGTAVNGINIVSGASNIQMMSNTLAATYSNSTLVNAGTLTAQSSNNPLFGSAIYDPASLGDGVGATTTIVVTGATLGDLSQVTFSNDLQGITLTSWVSSANTVSVRFQNESGGILDLASGILRAIVTKM